MDNLALIYILIRAFHVLVGGILLALVSLLPVPGATIYRCPGRFPKASGELLEWLVYRTVVRSRQL